MCLILDINLTGDYAATRNQAFKELKRWVEDKGMLVFAETEKCKQDMKNCSEAYLVLLKKYKREGIYKVLDTNAVEECTKELENMKIQSDDPHIIAIAQIGNVDLLATNDHDLIKDFKNSRLVNNGKIYTVRSTSNKDKRHLLDNAKCRRSK